MKELKRIGCLVVLILVFLLAFPTYGISAQVMRTGSVTTIQNSSQSGSQSVTVPTDATLCVVMAAFWRNATDWIAANPVTLNGVNLTTLQKTDNQTTNDQTWLGYLINPATGSRTLAWNWGMALDEGAIICVVFYKGVDTSNPVVSSATQTTDGADLTTGLTAGVGDMMVGVVAGTAAFTSVTDQGGTQLALSGPFNTKCGGFAQKLGGTGFYFTGGSYTTVSAGVFRGTGASVNQFTYSNTSSITIRDNNTANPYPSTITVPSVSGTVTKVTVTITGLSHTYPDDIRMLLVGPTGQNVFFMGEKGGDPDVSGVNLTFDDSAASELPEDTQISSGTYKPSPSFTQYNFPSPAPQRPPEYGTTLYGFTEVDPAGTWSLYVWDWSSGDSGSISGGWRLTLTVVSDTTALLTFKSKYVVTSSTPVSSSSTTLADDTPASQTFSLAASQTVLVIYNPFNNEGSTEIATGKQIAINVDGTDRANTWNSPYAANGTNGATTFWVGTLAAGSHTIKGRFASNSNGSTVTIDERVLLILILDGDAYWYIDDATAQPTTSASLVNDPNATQAFFATGACKALILYNIGNAGATEDQNGKYAAINLGGSDYSQLIKSPNLQDRSDNVFTLHYAALTAGSYTAQGRFASRFATYTVTISRRQLGVLLFADTTLADYVTSDASVNTTSLYPVNDTAAVINRTTTDARELLVIASATEDYQTSSRPGVTYGIQVDGNDRTKSRTSPRNISQNSNNSSTAWAETLAAGAHTVQGRYGNNTGSTAVYVTSRRIVALWFPAGVFQYRRPITIDRSKVSPCSSNPSNFPILISLSGDWLKTRPNGDICNSSGWDIIFRADDGVTQLDHEIEKYDGTNGVLIAWVRIPSLNYSGQSQNTTIYMYYGNAAITSQTANPTGVWDTNFKGVWHLTEDAAGTGTIGLYKDSTSNGNHGDDYASATGKAGKIGSGQQFDGTDDYINCGNKSSLDVPYITIEFWLNVTSWVADAGILAKGGNSNRQYWIWAYNNGGSFEIDQSTIQNNAWNPTAGQWEHLVLTYDGSNVITYRNGGAAEQHTYPQTTGTIDATTQPLLFGYLPSYSNYFNGYLDEIRISSVARDACWIQTEYNNQSNPGTFITLGSEEPSLVITGSYVGNGSNPRAITGVGFKPDIVIIKGNIAQDPVCSTSSMPANNAKALGSTTAGLVTGVIQSLDADGFTVTADARVNASSNNYYWVAFKAGVGELKVSSYLGTGGAQSITGVGFQPDWVVVMPAGAYISRHRSSNMTNCAYFNTQANDSTGITALGADGFSVDASLSQSSNTYHYFAFKKVSGKINVGSYTGDGSDNRNITGVGFAPQYVIVKCTSTSVANSGVAHPAPLSGDSSLVFGPSVNQADYIQALQTDGFQVGTSATVNSASTPYCWMAFGNNKLPTAVKLTSFTATEYPEGVLLKWKTGYEVRNLGFHVYREENGQLVRLTPELVAGSALMAGSRTALTAGHHYHWWDTSAIADVQGPLTLKDRPLASRTVPQVAGLEDRKSFASSEALLERSAPQAERSVIHYWLKEIDLNGTHTMHGPVTPVFSRDPLPEKFRPELLSEVGMRLQERYHHYWKVQELKERLALKRSEVRGAPLGRGLRRTPFEVKASNLKGRRPGPRGNLVPDPQTQQYLAGRAAVKILVREEGWYRVFQPELVAAGLSSKVYPHFLQLYMDGREQPIRVIGKGVNFDAIEFYGVGQDTASTDRRVYWLVEGFKPGKRVELSHSQGGRIVSSSFPHTVEIKDRWIYLPAIKNGEEENFFGAVVYGSGVEQLLNVQHLDPAPSEDALLEVVLQGATNVSHRVKVLINQEEAGELVFESQSKGLLQVEVPQAFLHEGDNLVTLIPQGGEIDVSLVDSIRLTYWHTYVADDNALRLRAQGGSHLTLSGFSHPKIRVMDITDSNDVIEVFGKVESQKGSYAVSLSVPGTGQRTLLALTEDKVKTPEEITPNQPSSWNQVKDGYDLVMIIHRDFLDALQPLKQLRESQGLKVVLIDVEDLYDEFSFGNKSPKAIKDFLASAKAKWSKPPRFVLLVGDASLDPRNYLGMGDLDFVPTKLVDTVYMETASDDWFVDLNSDGLPEIAVGRLPVQTKEEAAVVVSKIVGYEKSGKKSEALLVSDINDGFDFEGASEEIRAFLPSSLMVRKIYRGEFSSDAQANGVLLSAINQGPLLVNFIGHGSIEIWRGILSSDDAEGLINGMQLPFFVNMTCLNGYFQDPYSETLGEALIKAKGGGAIAIWASSGLTEPDKQALMNKEIIKLLFGRDSLTLGEATAKAKKVVSDQDIRKTWILFGDPATRLKP